MVLTAGSFNNIGSSQLVVAPGKRREFRYDVAFGPDCGNPDVYSVVGGPIVEGVLQGVNGTILAYGQVRWY
jgi:hypothetical protein